MLVVLDEMEITGIITSLKNELENVAGDNTYPPLVGWNISQADAVALLDRLIGVRDTLINKENN